MPIIVALHDTGKLVRLVLINLEINEKDEYVDIRLTIMGGPRMTPDEYDALIAEELIMIAKELGVKFKIVVWWKSGGEIGEEYAYGNTPEEVVNHMRSRCWIEEENKNSQKYMSGVQSRMIGAENFLFYDEESFLFGLVKIDSLHIQKWEWEPESDIE